MTFADGIVTTTTIRFDWRDRLRLLITGTVTVSTAVKTEHLIGVTENDYTHVYVKPVFEPRPVCGEAELPEATP